MLAIAEFGTGVRAHHQSLGLGQRLVRGEAVVDVYAAFIRNDVRAFAAGDQRGVEALAIIEPVHVHGGRLVGVESVQNVGRLVDGVLPHPCTGGVRGHAVGYDVEANRTVATALDAAVGGLADDGEIAGDPIGMGLDDFA